MPHRTLHASRRVVQSLRPAPHPSALPSALNLIHFRKRHSAHNYNSHIICGGEHPPTFTAGLGMTDCTPVVLHGNQPAFLKTPPRPAPYTSEVELFGSARDRSPCSTRSVSVGLGSSRYVTQGPTGFRGEVGGVWTEGRGGSPLGPGGAELLNRTLPSWHKLYGHSTEGPNDLSKEQQKINDATPKPHQSPTTASPKPTPSPPKPPKSHVSPTQARPTSIPCLRTGETWRVSMTISGCTSLSAIARCAGLTPACPSAAGCCCRCSLTRCSAVVPARTV